MASGKAQSASTTASKLQRRVRERFGVLPNFFRLSPETPEITEKLWGFAQAAYLDNPLPSVFKERLFVHLSRFCAVRYCIARHTGFLVGLGRPSGDKDARAESVEYVVKLLRRPLPRGPELNTRLALCSTRPAPLTDMPTANTLMEDGLFAFASHVFLQTADAPVCLDALERLLGTARLQYLLLFLAFVRAAHYWTRVHPEIEFEDDIKQLLATHEALASCILNDPEATADRITQSIVDELPALRLKADKAIGLLASIVDSSDDAIISKTLGGVILSWNAAAQQIFGYTPEEAIGQSITIIIPPELRDEEIDILRRLRAGERIEHYETLRVSKDGRHINVSITISPIRDAGGRIIGGSKIARDITERKRAEAAVRDVERKRAQNDLRDSEERFYLMAATAPLMLWMSGIDKLCTYVNRGWLEFTGRSADAELGDGWAESIHSEDLDSCLNTYSQAFDRRERFQMEYRLRRHDGEYRWILDQGVPRFNANGSFAGYVGSANDVTERKLAEEYLSKVNQKLIQAHEEERTRIARELHDDINQRIALLTVQLKQWTRHPPSSEANVRKHIGSVCEQLTDLGRDVQALSHRLHSSKLEYLGIGVAAGSFCKELSEQQQVEIEFSQAGIPHSLPKEIALCLFRVLQEALQNAVKHSGERHFRVELHGTSRGIQLTVNDQGVGFDEQDAMGGRGLGLISMRERMQLVGGAFSIESKPGGGTTIRARVPFIAEEHRASVAG
jgi:PAS domain S-box-containing protein